MCDIKIELGGGAGFAVGAFVMASLGMYDGAAVLFGIALVFGFFLLLNHIPRIPIVIFLTGVVFVFIWFIFMYFFCPPTYVEIASHIAGWFDNLIGGIQDSISRFFNRLWDVFMVWFTKWWWVIVIIVGGLIAFPYVMTYIDNRR